MINKIDTFKVLSGASFGNISNKGAEPTKELGARERIEAHINNRKRDDSSAWKAKATIFQTRRKLKVSADHVQKIHNEATRIQSMFDKLSSPELTPEVLAGHISDINSLITDVKGSANYGDSTQLQSAVGILSQAATDLLDLRTDISETSYDPAAIDSLMSDTSVSLAALDADMTSVLALAVDEGEGGGEPGEMTAGDEFSINENLSSDQKEGAVTALSGGGYVVTYMNQDADENGKGISAQLFDAEGNTVGSEFTVNTTTDGNQETPAITALSDGGFVIAYQSNNVDNGDGKDILAQKFDAAGTKVGAEVLVNSSVTQDQLNPSLNATSDGGFVAVWETKAGGDWDIAARKFDANMTPASAEFQINTTISAGNQKNADVTALSGGGFVVSFQDEGSNDGDKKGIFAQVFDAGGDAIGTEIQINTTTLGDQKESSIGALDDGGFVVAYQNGSEISARRFDSVGTAVTGEFQVNAATDGNQEGVTVTGLGDGGYMIAYRSKSATFGGEAIVAQRFYGDDSKVGDEFAISVATDGSQEAADIAATADGFVVTYQSGANKEIFATQYTIEGMGEPDDSLTLPEDIERQWDTLRAKVDGFDIAGDLYAQSSEVYYRMDNLIADLDRLETTDEAAKSTLKGQIETIRTDFSTAVTAETDSDTIAGVDSLVADIAGAIDIIERSSLLEVLRG